MKDLAAVKRRTSSAIQEREGRLAKRAIERLLVQPLSNLLATGQIQRHDRIRVTHNGESPSLTFFRQTDA